jgi:hypothetical protein
VFCSESWAPAAAAAAAPAPPLPPPSPPPLRLRRNQGRQGPGQILPGAEPDGGRRRRVRCRRRVAAAAIAAAAAPAVHPRPPRARPSAAAARSPGPPPPPPPRRRLRSRLCCLCTPDARPRPLVLMPLGGSAGQCRNAEEAQGSVQLRLPFPAHPIARAPGSCLEPPGARATGTAVSTAVPHGIHCVQCGKRSAHPQALQCCLQVWSGILFNAASGQRVGVGTTRGPGPDAAPAPLPGGTGPRPRHGPAIFSNFQFCF